jgi:hypothetical protein
LASARLTGRSSGSQLEQQYCRPQRAEVDPLLGGEVDGELLLVPLPLGVGDLHREGVMMNAVHHLAPHFLLLTLQLPRQRGIFRGGPPHNAARRLGRRCRRLGEAAPAAPAPALLRGDRAQRRHPAEILPSLDLHDHGIVERERLGGRPGEEGFAVPFEPDFDDVGQLTSRSTHPWKGTSLPGV